MVFVFLLQIWNERPFNLPYIKLLRKTLDQRGLKGTLIVAADNLELISIAIHNDRELAKDVAVIGYAINIISP